MLLPFALHAQDEVAFEFSDGIDGTIKATMEQNTTRLLTAINRAESRNADINYSGIGIDNLASQSIGMMWNNVHFRVVDDDIVEHWRRHRLPGAQHRRGDEAPRQLLCGRPQPGGLHQL